MTETTGDNDQAGRHRLSHVIKTIPVVDNHAHPLLLPAALPSYPFEGVVSEAKGDALSFSPSSLAHVRATKQLASLHSCAPTWEAVVKATEGKRDPNNYEAWIGRCLSGTETILFDDGLGNPDELYSYGDLSAYTKSACWRVVRIERVVEDIINRLLEAAGNPPLEPGTIGLQEVVTRFDDEISAALKDPRVAAFKSVICYRTGLKIPTLVPVSMAESALARELFRRKHTSDTSRFRLDQPSLNEFFLLRAAQLIQEGPPHARRILQIHTGFGDNDLDLSRSSPSHLQEFIRAHPSIQIVLLHAGYPFSREAGYLANTYANVWVDVGEVFPCVSRAGQEAVLHQLLELSPWSKLLFSTDGSLFPETYYLGQLQFKEVLETVLVDYARKGDLTWKDAENIAVGILYQNANQLYELKLPKPQIAAHGLDLVGSQIPTSTIEQHPLQILDTFLTQDPDIRYLRVYWNDITGTPRVRAVDIDYVKKRLREGSFSVGITKASLGLLQNDTLAPGATPTGEFKFHPDWSWVKRGPRPCHLSVYGEFRTDDGLRSHLCPRSTLKKVVESARSLGYEFILGFELELVLMQKEADTITRNQHSDGHCWSSSRMLDRPIFSDVIEKAISYLRSVDVSIEQVHAESAPGQFEVVLPAAPTVQAVDNLLFVREVIASVAAASGYHMTLHPKPFSMAAGNAAHVHMSISSPGGDDPAVYESFYAGVLDHLRSICAFTYSHPASYERVVDGCWAGGTWVAWGTQNRETPLRKVKDSHWELKCMDGMANPYLAMAAVLSAGVHGIRTETSLRQKDCPRDPATLSPWEKTYFGVVDMLPGNLYQALDDLQRDTVLSEVMGPELVERYVAVKWVEIKNYEPLGVEERRQWVSSIRCFFDLHVAYLLSLIIV